MFASKATRLPLRLHSDRLPTLLLASLTNNGIG
jgi:hypothetical protein